MDLQDIRRATLSIYKDGSPDFLRGVLTDALADLTPARTWSQWLEESETIHRLAELMAWLLEEANEGTTPALAVWLDQVVGTSWREVSHDDAAAPWYAAICAAYGVPAVMIETGVMLTAPMLDDGGNEEQSVHFIWYPPSVELALATLGEAVQAGTHELSDAHLGAIVVRSPEAAHQSPPGVDAYRLRVGTGEWVVRGY